MAEFAFYSLKDEWRMLLESVVREHSLRFVHDAWYPSSIPPMHAEVTSQTMDELINGKPRVYLFGSFSTRGPFLHRQPEGPKAGQYSVDLTRGGPGLDLVLPGCYQDGAVLRLPRGNLFVRPDYCDESGNWYRAPEQVRQAFDEIRKTLKKGLKRVRFPESRWVSPGALELIGSGKAMIQTSKGWRGQVDLLTSKANTKNDRTGA